MSHESRVKLANEIVAKTRESVKNGYYRNHYHFMPPAGWMNDPNGMIFYKGQYHLFYQHQPEPMWKSLHWGHAVSDDLIHWKQLPIALAPSEEYDDYLKGGCWSGTAVDYNDELHIFYTSCIAGEDGKDIQRQCKAVSSDTITFTKHKKNPIVTAPNEFTSYDFRDPKVWIDNGVWYMLCATRHGKNGCLIIFKSNDGESFEFLNVFNESDGTLGGMWECPDFFSIGDKDIFIFSPMGAKEHKTYYMVGKLDRASGKFKEEYCAPLDFGDDFYAPQTFSGTAERVIMLGWMQPFWKNETIPTVAQGWLGSMSIPRELTLNSDNKLIIKPIEKLKALRIDEHATRIAADNISAKRVYDIVDGLHYEAELSISLANSSAKKATITFGSGENEVLAELNLTDKTICMDITRHDDKSARKTSMPMMAQDGMIKLHMFVDSCTLEIFNSDYTAVLSKTMYPSQNAANILIDVIGGNLLVETLVVYPLKKVMD